MRDGGPKWPMEINRFAYAHTLIVILAIVVAADSRLALASDAAPTPAPPAVCSTESPRLPNNVDLAASLRADVEEMLRWSATFRAQCRRIADTRLLYVRVRLDPKLAARSFRAKSLIQRAHSGVLMVVVELCPYGSPIEWIAHEFEHVLEQVDGVRLLELADRSGVWRTSDGMFETDRAIRAGRTVAEEIRRGKNPRSYILVE